MSALEPGLYRATVRGAADVVVLIDKNGTAHHDWTLTADGDSTSHTWGITDARPLIVLELLTDDRWRSSRLVRDLRRMDWGLLADQIEAQTKVAPSEPTDPAVRVKAGPSQWAKVGGWWVCADMGEVPREWDYLVDLGVEL